MPALTDGIDPSREASGYAGEGNTLNAPTPIAPKDFSFPLRLLPHTILQMQLTSMATSTLVFLTTSSPSNPSSISALGSFVYAMPNRLSPMSPPLSTSLYAQPSSVEFATRVAKIIAKRTTKPTYIGCSIVLEGATVDEEMEVTQVAIDGILKGLGDGDQGEVTANGVH